MRITLLIFIAIFQDLLSQAKDRKMGYYTTFWRPCLTLIDFITELFCRVDDDMKGVSKDPRSHLWPSELVSIGVLYVLKAQSQSRFYRWLKANYLDLFPMPYHSFCQILPSVYSRNKHLQDNCKTLLFDLYYRLLKQYPN